jgi:transcriptional regulator with XRE-family HTH domain
MQLSQQELARRLDVYQTTISQWERGERGIRHGRMLALALWALEHGAGEEGAETCEKPSSASS